MYYDIAENIHLLFYRLKTFSPMTRGRVLIASCALANKTCSVLL